MKRWICLLLVIISLLMLYGCGNDKHEFVYPISVYYCRNEVTHHSPDGVFAKEMKEFSGFENDLQGFLNQYLNGPYSEELSSPFPAGSKILDLEPEENGILVKLSIHFSSLSGNEQTLAYACICKTIFELVDCTSIHLLIPSQNGNDDSSITMTKDQLLLIDDAQLN